MKFIITFIVCTFCLISLVYCEEMSLENINETNISKSIEFNNLIIAKPINTFSSCKYTLLLLFFFISNF